MQSSRTVNHSAKTVLVAPLDWGLGHATRCIPVVEHLLDHACKVVLCTDGAPAALLRRQFGERVQYELLPGYGIRYGRGSVLSALLPQVPHFLQAIRMERAWLHRMIGALKPNGTISDNRYGFHHPDIPAVLLTHQLQPALPRSWNFLTGTVRRQVFRMVESFDACWVPDLADKEASLSGLLGHPQEVPPVPVQHLGTLSHMVQWPEWGPVDWDLLCILSGPEPQRTMLEKLLLQQAQHLPGSCLIIRGLPDLAAPLPMGPSNVRVINFAASGILEGLISRSRFVLCRGGYSSLMDLIPRGVRCLLIPTPGQTEQEYLAHRLQEKHMAISMPQHQLNLQQLLLQAEAFYWKPANLPIPNSGVAAVVDPWLQSIR